MQVLCGRGGIASRNLTVCPEENALRRDSQKEDGQLNARLVVQRLTDQRRDKIPTSSPTASRQWRQIFFAASLGFQTHSGDVKCTPLQGDLDDQLGDVEYKLSQRSQVPPSSLENCNWSITSVSAC